MIAAHMLRVPYAITQPIPKLLRYVSASLNLQQADGYIPSCRGSTSTRLFPFDSNIRNARLSYPAAPR